MVSRRAETSQCDPNGKQALVAAGCGVMLVPLLAGAALRADVVVRPTTPRLPPRAVYAAVAEPPFRTPPAEAMLSVLAGAGPSTGLA